MVMVSDLFKALGCFAVAGVLLAAPVWVPALARAAAAEAAAADEADALRGYEHPEDEFCSGATPDCPSHWECWNLLPPTCH